MERGHIGVYTDLALEARDLVREQTGREISGVEVETDGTEDIQINRVRITSPVGERAIGKPMGNYITIDVPRLRRKNDELHERVGQTLAQELSTLTNLDEDATVLVVGLGNWNVTPDALGPRVVHHLLVTRHLKKLMPEKVRPGFRSVCALAPGVLGLTGIETGEIIRGVVDRVRPDMIIAIDALASRSMERVGTTIQIADTGIHPGSGVGNKRMGLTRETLGIPVYALGLPTVVHATTIARDSIDRVIKAMKEQAGPGSKLFDLLESLGDENKNQLIADILEPYVGDLMVTPKEIDAIIEDISQVVAGGLNVALHPAIEMDEINTYIQ